jgi:ATP-dependent Zn protease
VSIRPRVIVAFLIVIATAVVAYRIFIATGSQPLDQSSFYEAVKEGRIREVTMVPDSIGFGIRGTLKSESTSFRGQSAENFTTYVLADRELLKLLRMKGVSVKAERPRRGFFFSMIGPLIFLLLFAAVFVFFMLRAANCWPSGDPGPSSPLRPERSPSRTWPDWRSLSRSLRRSSSSSGSQTSFRGWAARSRRGCS